MQQRPWTFTFRRLGYHIPLRSQTHRTSDYLVCHQIQR